MSPRDDRDRADDHAFEAERLVRTTGHEVQTAALTHAVLAVFYLVRDRES